MKRLLLAAALIGLGTTAAAAQTADSPWNGFYFGIHEGGGYGLARMATSQVAGGVFGTYAFDRSTLTQGVFAGAQIGFRWQTGPVILGAEATLSATNIDGQANCGDDGTGPYGYICNTSLNAIGTLTGHLGIAAGNTQFYVNAGAAWARHSYSIREPFWAYVTACPPCLVWGAGSDSAWGWTVGFGVEHLLSHGLSFRADYAYTRFPTRNVVLTSPVWPSTTTTVGQSYHFVSVGLNYRFGHDDDPMMTYGDGGGWDIAFGKRAWLNFSSHQLDLFDPLAPTSQISQLVHGPSFGFTGEAFLNANSPGGFFVNAMYGTGVSGGGQLVDEDYPPYIVPMSRAVSDLHNGRLSYFGLDLGYRFYNGPNASAGAFVGVTGILTRYEAFGCTQVATNPACLAVPVPSDYEVITQTSGWAGVRLGLTGDVAVAQRVTLRGQAAFLPLVLFGAVDNHWLRPDINPLIEFGRGFGFQLEAALDFAVTDQLTIGIGGRYWQVWAAGDAVFPPGTEPQSTVARQYGAFLEATYAVGH